MKVLVISDTHGRLANLERVLDKVCPLDLILHLGDIEGDHDIIRSMAGCPVVAVKGNNDFFSKDPSEQVVELGKHKALLAHGHRHNVYFGTDRLEWRARELGADIVFHGHTHVPHMDLSGDVWVMCPGSITQPRGGSRYSYIVLDIDRNGEVHPTMCQL